MSGPVTITTHKVQISDALAEIYQQAGIIWSQQNDSLAVSWHLSEQLMTYITNFWNKAVGNAVSAITNLTTCLICKVVEPAIDCRFYREPKDGMPQPPDGANNYFRGRTISERLVAPLACT